MPPYPDSPLHTLIPPADEKRLLYEAPDRVLKATPMKRVIEAVRLLDALEGLDAVRSRIVLTRDFGGWICTPADPDCHPVSTPTDAAENALARARGTASAPFEVGSIEIKHGEIPAAALGDPPVPQHDLRTHGENCKCRDCRADFEAAIVAGQRLRVLRNAADPPVPQHDLLPCPDCGKPARMFIPFYDGRDNIPLAEREVRIHCASSEWERHPIVRAVGDVEAAKVWNELPRVRADAPLSTEREWCMRNMTLEASWCALCGNATDPARLSHGLCPECDAATTQRPEEVEVPAATGKGFPWKCKLCDRQATSVASGEGPRCDEHASDTAGDELSFPAGTIRVKRGDPIPRGYFAWTSFRPHRHAGEGGGDVSDNSNNGYILGMWRYEILDARYGGFCAFLNDCVRAPEIMLSCGGKLWLVEIKDEAPHFTEAQPEWFSELRRLERDGLWEKAWPRRVMPDVGP